MIVCSYNFSFSHFLIFSFSHFLIFSISQSLLRFPIFIVLEVDVPDGTAIFHEGRWHAANTLDGCSVGILHFLVDSIALDTGKEIMETILVGCLVGRTQPYVTDRTDIITEVSDGVVAVGRLHVRHVTSREGVGNLSCTHLIGNSHT